MDMALVANPEGEGCVWRPKYSLCTQDVVPSPAFTAANLQWCLMLHPKGARCNDKSYGKYLAVFLKPYDTPHSPYAIVTFSITIEHPTHSSRTLSYTTHQTFVQGGIEDWGFSQLVPLIDLENPQQGWLDSDILTIKLLFKAVTLYPPIGPPTPITATNPEPSNPVLPDSVPVVTAAVEKRLDPSKLYKLTFVNGVLQGQWKAGVMQSLSQLLGQLDEAEAVKQLWARYHSFYQLHLDKLAMHYQQLYDTIKYLKDNDAVRALLIELFQVGLIRKPSSKPIEVQTDQGSTNPTEDKTASLGAVDVKMENVAPVDKKLNTQVNALQCDLCDEVLMADNEKNAPEDQQDDAAQTKQAVQDAAADNDIPMEPDSSKDGLPKTDALMGGCGSIGEDMAEEKGEGKEVSLLALVADKPHKAGLSINDDQCSNMSAGSDWEQVDKE